MRRRRTPTWREHARRERARLAQRDRAERRERARIERIDRTLVAVINDAMRVREARGPRRVLVHWGQRAIDALIRAKRAVSEARLFGSR